VMFGFDGPGYHARLADAALVGAELAGRGHLGHLARCQFTPRL
jgi:hypothetical protein